MHICMHACMLARMHTRMYSHVYWWIYYVYRRQRVIWRGNRSMILLVCIDTYVHMYTCTHVHMYTCIYIHTYHQGPTNCHCEPSQTHSATTRTSSRTHRDMRAHTLPWWNRRILWLVIVHMYTYCIRCAHTYIIYNTHVCVHTHRSSMESPTPLTVLSLLLLYSY